MFWHSTKAFICCTTKAKPGMIPMNEKVSLSKRVLISDQLLLNQAVFRFGELQGYSIRPIFMYQYIMGPLSSFQMTLWPQIKAAHKAVQKPNFQHYFSGESPKKALSRVHLFRMPPHSKNLVKLDFIFPSQHILLKVLALQCLISSLYLSHNQKTPMH